MRKRFNYPGMKVLQFAFNSDENNTYLPENFDPEDRFVVYTGTHDNNTTRGWYENADKNEKEMLRRYVKKDTGVVWQLIKMAFSSNAMWAVIPLQDLLELGSSARMNTPGTISGNWKWQLDEFNLSEKRTNELRDLTRESGRDTL
ncbi:MAG: 4-alpha-glucanotransferase [Candidatus Marinimicrobia bacterium]|nr:4-alpha-glucanotransferase [Candidatus Neomarinimicrobiota bacterium]